MFVRPAELNQKISETFEEIKKITHWGNNGTVIQSYEMIIDEMKIINQMLTKVNELRVLELGSGMNYGFVKHVSQSLKSTGNNKRIIIVGTTGENIEDKITIDGNIETRFLGNFCVENLDDDERIKGMTFHVIASSYCLRHLCDGIGTVIRSIDQLETGGFLLCDSFYGKRNSKLPLGFTIIDESGKFLDEGLVGIIIDEIFRAIDVNYISTPLSNGRGIGSYIIQKKNTTDTSKVSNILRYSSFHYNDNIEFARSTVFEYKGKTFDTNVSENKGKTFVANDNECKGYSIGRWFDIGVFRPIDIGKYFCGNSRELFTEIFGEQLTLKEHVKAFWTKLLASRRNVITIEEVIKTIEPYNRMIPQFADLTKDQMRDDDLIYILYNTNCQITFIDISLL